MFKLEIKNVHYPKIILVAVLRSMSGSSKTWYLESTKVLDYLIFRVFLR